MIFDILNQYFGFAHVWSVTTSIEPPEVDLTRAVIVSATQKGMITNAATLRSGIYETTTQKGRITVTQKQGGSR